MCGPADIDAVGATYRLLKHCYERDVKPHHRTLEGQGVTMDALVVKRSVGGVGVPRRLSRLAGSAEAAARPSEGLEEQAQAD
jgi:hypothetical protein